MNTEDIEMIYSLKSYCWKICGSTTDAEDIIQDVLFAILNNIETFNGMDPAGKRRYAIRAIHSKVIDRHRRFVCKARVKHHVPIEQSNLSVKPDVFGKIELKEVMKKGRKYRHFPTLMLQVQGYTSFEIAEMTGTNLNTVLGSFRYTRIFLKK